ncbi:MAG: hypothetical protein FWD60_11905 [Candidatus Azobacteroides sp.]|nr:hypothetical protein [Candidatus Azobacteroides sp.]
MKWRNILSGFIGASVLMLLLLSITAWLKPFNYQAVYIVNPEVVVKTDTLSCNHISVLKDLEHKGILLTPEEYTSHISSYYSTLVAFLIGLFVLFTVGSIIGIRITSKKEIDEAKDDLKEKLKDSLASELKDSKSFYENIINDILGRLEDDLITKADKEFIDKNIDNITHKQIELEESINLLFDEIDSKSEIKK